MKILLYLVLFFLFAQRVYPAPEFVIEDVRVEGLKRITTGTVFNYLPIEVGDTYDDSISSEIVTALFETGFFKDIRLARDGNILVLIFEERPAIGSITFSGNEDIKSEDLIDSLQQIGFAEGRSFDRFQLEKLEQELVRQYHSLGKYSVTVDSSITELDDNRVAVSIEIVEGVVARIKKINIVGNTAYDEDELFDVFESVKSTFFIKKNQYSRQKLTADLETLRSQYLNAGYINFNIDSTQVSITPDKKNIYITINITEGGVFTISEVKLTSNLDLSEQEVVDLISVRKGDIFSRRQFTNSSESLTQYLGKRGYAFANVNVIPEINEDDYTVAVDFFIDAGDRAYVRRINFHDNLRTRDEVLRREMRQQESSWISTEKVERGKIRLQRLGFFGEVNVETLTVPGTSDQVDINYSVAEVPSGSLSLGVGFSQTSGVTLKMAIAQENFLGSGKRIDFAFSNSNINRHFKIGYVNPYYTLNGVSRSLRMFYQETDSLDANIISFDRTVWGGGFGFGIPITEFNFISTLFSYENTNLTTTTSTNPQINNFFAEHGTAFNIFRWSNSVSFDTRNKAILPTSGRLHRLNAEITLPSPFGDSLEFYKMRYETQWFNPLTEEYILILNGEIGYGDSYGSGQLPFFENFYAGGPRSIRGYKENTLGPIDSSSGRPLGGNVRLVAGTELVLPIPFIKNIPSFRLSSFVDAGNIYGIDEDFDLGTLRYSVGLSGIWVSPLGLISVSIAQPLATQPQDQTESFQFNFGTSF